MVTTSHPTQPPSAPITPEELLGGCAAFHASILSRARRSREAEPGAAVQAMICTSGSAFQVSTDHSSSPTSGCRNSLVSPVRGATSWLFHRQPGPLPAGSPDRTVRHLQLPTDVADLLFGGMMLHLATFAFTR